MTVAERLHEVIREDVALNMTEPAIYSPYPPGENTNQYDTMGTIYDRVACNRFYNRLIWGYWPSEYDVLCRSALASSKAGWVLDAGCGSLAFTAKTYIDCSERPIVFLDQSMTLLRMAKEKLIELTGSVPTNMVFLHGDVLSLPFRPKSFRTVISMNVLHALQDVKRMLNELRNVLSDGGTISLTTLVENNRLADRYIHMLGRADALVPRSMDEVLQVFDEIGMPVTHLVTGNMAFISYG